MNVTESNLEVHLTTAALVCRDNTRRAFALNELDQPTRTAATAEKNLQLIHGIIDWLDVEDSSRYQKSNSSSYCNIYAHDYSYLCQAYIPRVWWDDKSITSIHSGQPIKPKYGENVYELNANALHQWFVKFAAVFGWRSTDNLNELQESANNGKVCIIVARRKNLKRSGHITAVVPETNVFLANREHGQVVNPVESQAGSRNHQYVTKQNQWWAKEKFQSSGFWIHD